MADEVPEESTLEERLTEEYKELASQKLAILHNLLIEGHDIMLLGDHLWDETYAIFSEGTPPDTIDFLAYQEANKDLYRYYQRVKNYHIGFEQ